MCFFLNNTKISLFHEPEVDIMWFICQYVELLKTTTTYLLIQHPMECKHDINDQDIIIRKPVECQNNLRGEKVSQ